MINKQKKGVCLRNLKTDSVTELYASSPSADFKALDKGVCTPFIPIFQMSKIRHGNTKKRLFQSHTLEAVGEPHIESKSPDS